MKEGLRLLRPKQWTKGLLVFAALLFTRSYLEPDKVRDAVLAFVAMGLVSSAVYVFNDLLDRERDRRHPIKKDRPLASGRVSVPVATFLLILCGAGGLAIGAWLGRGALAILIVYLALQTLYNLGLKRQPIADVFTIASGFILRAMLGAAAISVRVSPWLLLCTGALALLLGFAKRRHEFLLLGESRHTSRESLEHYNRRSLDAFVVISACGAAMSYSLYTLDSPTAARYPSLFLTCLFVFYGIYRYVFLVFGHDEGGEPENLLFRDPHMVISVVGFTLAALAALSGFRIPFIEGGPVK